MSSSGYVAVVKQDCPTCVLIEPVLQQLEAAGVALTVYVQDDPDFPKVSNRVDDRALDKSFELDIETVPTLIRFNNGTEQARLIGWEQNEWRSFTGIEQLGEGLPTYRPGCGSKSVEPGIAEQLALRHGTVKFNAREVSLAELEDDIEACFDRGWSDGLPVVPPTPERVLRMLNAVAREGHEIIGQMPPFGVDCSVEKVAINAVMAGCKPAYFPVVLAAVEAALDPAFCLHGLLATTWFSGPMVIVNGPVRQAIGMNWQGNLLGQGNRANASIGRALQLTVRNVGGGLPQDTDQSTYGTPLKFGCCFAEDDATPWQTVAETMGVTSGRSAVTLFSADGPLGVADQKSRDPESLVQSLAGSLKAVNHVEMANGSDAVVLIGPEHGRVFDQAGWSKADVTAALHQATHIAGKDLAMGTTDAAKASAAESTGTAGQIPKFRPGGLYLVRAGGDAGLFSAIIPGWVMKGSVGTDPVTREIR